jgi:signal transduction histidine kinase
MTLRTKLVLAQSPLMLGILVVGVLSLNTITELGKRSELILSENYRSVLAAQRMKESIERMDSAAMFRYSGKIPEARDMVALHRPRFEGELKVQEANITEPGEAESTRRLRSVWDRYQEKYRAFDAVQDPDAQKAVYFGELNPAFVAVKEAADDILTLNQDAMRMKSDHAQRAAERLTRVTTMGFALALITGLLISAALTHRALRPLSSLNQAARRIGEGDLEFRVRAEGEDEIAQLAREFNTMVERLNEYRNSSLGDLLRTQHQMQAALDSIPDPLLITAPGGEVLTVNSATRDLLEIDVGEEAADLWKFVPPGVKEVLERVGGHVLSGKGPYVPRGFEESVRLAFPSGDRFFLPRATAVYGKGRQVVAAAIILQDITRLRRFDELRNDSVATVAHEFRTPLTSLQMAIHLCVSQKVGPLTEKQADLLEAAREDCARLQTLVEDLLNLSRIQTGKVEMQRRPVPLRELVDPQIAGHRSEAESRQVRLSAEMPSEAASVLADPVRISLVLSNLISNAIRHTGEGGRVTVRSVKNGSQVRVEVSDTGEGIAPEFRERIFEKFYQVPGAKVGGSGLGLTIAKEVVLAHEGQIGVESDIGKGSTFWFALPSAG